MTRILFAKGWRIPKLMTALFIIEFPLTVAMLTLFGVAQPNTYRTKLWQNGSDLGFNSNPNQAVYALANYRTAHIPVVWSQFLTDFNVIISVLSMFILLTKVTLYVMHWFAPALSLFVHAALVALYAVSIRNQITPDLSDPQHPSPGMPWYLSKGCSYAYPANYGYCMQARASFGVSVVMLALFVAYLINSILNLKPTAEEKEERIKDIEMRKLEKIDSRPGTMTAEEYNAYNRALFLNLPKTPATPYSMNPMTPRTTAFTRLNGGKAPEVIVSSYSNTSPSSGPDRKLPFREQYSTTS